MKGREESTELKLKKQAVFSIVSYVTWGKSLQPLCNSLS